MAQMGASRAQPSLYPWGQLAFGIACMVMIANLQYGWTLFVRPMSQAHGWAIADIQIAFSIFVALETWLTPVEGWLADRLGPKLSSPWAASSSRSAGSSTRRPTASPFSMPARWSPGSAPGRSMQPAWGSRSSGSPTGAGWPSA
jgi:hypothetical protein